MPTRPKYQLIQCQYFGWRLRPRDGVWYADGRSNRPNPGRHSLNTRDLTEAKAILAKIDLRRAIDLGLAKQSQLVREPAQPLFLDDGRRQYDAHIKRPVVAGGVKASTAKRYRSVFEKFLPFSKNQGTVSWNEISLGLLHSFASHLAERGYAAKTIRNELVTIVQAHSWLIDAGHLAGVDSIKLQLRKVESERPYCYTVEEVAAIVSHCRSTPSLRWLANVVVALATTGLRIAELAGVKWADVKWADVDLGIGRLTLSDETGYAGDKTRERRQLKSGRSRSLPFHPNLAAVLSDVQRSDAYVFHGPRGGRLKPDTVRQILIREVLTPLANRFSPADGKKGFANGRLHSFRHYFASTCANGGVPERVTMEWLGHADSAMVRHYYHLHDEEAQRQMRRLDILGEAGTQLPGIPGAAINQMEATSQKGDPTIAS